MMAVSSIAGHLTNPSELHQAIIWWTQSSTDSDESAWIWEETWVHM